jgi:hypothetical protein
VEAPLTLREQLAKCPGLFKTEFLQVTAGIAFSRRRMSLYVDDLLRACRERGLAVA